MTQFDSELATCQDLIASTEVQGVYRPRLYKDVGLCKHFISALIRSISVKKEIVVNLHECTLTDLNFFSLE